MDFAKKWEASHRKTLPDVMLLPLFAATANAVRRPQTLNLC